MRFRQVKDFALRIKLVRFWMGLTQQQMAERMAISPGTLSCYEADTRCPTTKQVREFAEKLGVDFEWLCGLGKTFPWE